MSFLSACGYGWFFPASAIGANEATRIEQVMTMTLSRVRCFLNMTASFGVVVDCTLGSAGSRVVSRADVACVAGLTQDGLWPWRNLRGR